MLSRVLFASVVLAVGCTAVATGLQLPADVAITGGRAVHGICAPCCQANAYCGTLSEDVSMYDSNGNILNVPKGSNMTCLLRDRSMPSQVDGGLCVPSSLPAEFSIAEMCMRHDKTLSSSHTLTQVVYQSGLVPQKQCGACYDGYHFCAAELTCRRLLPDASRSGGRLPKGICFPDNGTDTTCGQRIDMQHELRHESCDRPTPAAELFEQQHSMPFRRRLQMASLPVSSSSRKLLQAYQTSEHTARKLLSTPAPTSLPRSAVLPQPTVSLSKTIPALISPVSKTTPKPSITASPSPTPKAKSTGATPSPTPKHPAPTPTSKRTPSPTWTPHAFAPSSSGGGQPGWCNKVKDCALPQYHMCQKGKCVKKPGYCESNKHCKAGYECQKHFCALKKQAPAKQSPAPAKQSPAPKQKQ